MTKINNGNENYYDGFIVSNKLFYFKFDIDRNICYT